MGQINDLWAASADHVETLSKTNAADMPKVLAKLVTSYLAQELQLVSAAATAAIGADIKPSSSEQSSAVAGSNAQLSAPVIPKDEYLIPVLCKGMQGVGKMTYDTASLDGSIEPTTMFRHSAPGSLIPFAEAAAAAVAASGSDHVSGNTVSSSWSQQVDDAQARLVEFSSTVGQSAVHAVALQQVQQLWQQSLARPAVQGQVSRLVEVLEGAVLPHNKHTRRRAEESGPTLHLPGLVKAASSNYTSKKIFARKTAGGKRTYQVALLLDVSQSMQGHLLQCGLETLMMFTEALGQAGLDDFVVMTFGSQATLVKGSDTPWDQTSQLALLDQINCRPGEADGAVSQQCLMSTLCRLLVPAH